MYAKVIALAGASGVVGKPFVNALLREKAFQVHILTRASSIGSAPLQDFQKLGATLHAISYDDEASIVKALQGVDVLISTVSHEAILSGQIPLVKAAKTAGVKTFFPSEYGSIFAGSSHPSPVFNGKKIVLKTAQQIGLPTTILHIGGFPESCLIPPLGYNFAERKVTIWGDGNAKISWTTVKSVADWVVNVLKTVPIMQLQDKRFKIQGNVLSSNDIINLWEQKHNAKLDIERHPIKELDDRLTADPNDILAALLQEWHSGRGENGGADNHLYPGWKPETIDGAL